MTCKPSPSEGVGSEHAELARDDSRAIAMAVGRRRNLVSHALFRDPYFPSITVCAISRGANDGRRDVVVSGPARMGVTVCVDGGSLCSPLSESCPTGSKFQRGMPSSTPKKGSDDDDLPPPSLELVAFTVPSQV